MPMPNVKITMVDKVLEIIAPHLCSGCSKIGSPLCDHCKYDIIEMPFVGCLVCFGPTSVGVCLEHNKSYKNAWIVGLRTGTLQRLIGGFKFQNMKAAAKNLAKLLDERLPQLPENTRIVPIPTAPAHIRERGYDHLLLIARYFAQYRQLAISPVLKRANTATQHTANRQTRQLQAKSAFQLADSIDPNVPYLLLDDVITTGSTIDEASQLLSLGGARTVWVGALARQPLD